MSSFSSKAFVGLGAALIVSGAVFEWLNPDALATQMILMGVGWLLVGIGFDLRGARQKVTRGLGFAFVAAGLVVGVIWLATHVP
jgi:hypothetical protein